MDQLEWVWESIRMDARHYQKKKFRQWVSEFSR